MGRQKLFRIPIGEYFFFFNSFFPSAFFSSNRYGVFSVISSRQICTDREGKSNHDSLVVSIYNTTKPMPSAEFDMMFKVPGFDEFNRSAKLKKLFVEQVAKLFGDPNTANIVVLGVGSSQGMTKVTWYNKTLDFDRCEEDKILRLRQVCKRDTQ